MIRKIFLKCGLLLLMATMLAITATPAMATSAWQQVGGDLPSGPTSFFVYNGTPYVAIDASGKASVMEYDGTSWQPVGSPGFSSGRADWVSLFVSDGTPYMGCWDGSDCQFTAMKYDGRAWAAYGNSVTMSIPNSFYVYQGTPFVAYEEDSGNVTVMECWGDAGWRSVGDTITYKYTGNWEELGTVGYGYNSPVSLVIYQGTPYVAVRNTVMKYDGKTWEPVGNADFLSIRTDYESLCVYNGTPYVAYRSQTLDESSTISGVMEYNGASWVPVGNFDSSDACQSLFVYNETPYVACIDASDKAMVMEYDGTAWQPVGSPDFSSGQVDWVSLFVDNGTPYLAYDYIGADGDYHGAVMEYANPTHITYPVYAGTNVSVSGTAAPGATIKLSVNGTEQPAVTADASGNWTVSGLPLHTGDIISMTAQASVDGISQAATPTVTVASVALASFTKPPDINVASGTTIGSVSLPATVQVDLSNGITGNADATWDTSSYNGSIAGTYTFPGTLSNLPEGAANPNNLTASVNVIVGTSASTEPIQVNINGSPLQMDVPPVIVNGRAMVPLRAIFEALGATVQWNAGDQSIVATKGNTTIKLQIGSTTALDNGSQATLDATPQIVDGRTLVPARFVGEALGAQVNWDGANRQVNIVTASH